LPYVGWTGTGGWCQPAEVVRRLLRSSGGCTRSTSSGSTSRRR